MDDVLTTMRAVLEIMEGAEDDATARAAGTAAVVLAATSIAEDIRKILKIVEDQNARMKEALPVPHVTCDDAVNDPHAPHVWTTPQGDKRFCIGHE